MVFYISANIVEILMDHCIGISQDLTPKLPQFKIPFDIFQMLESFPMLASIQFDHSRGIRYVKIDDVMTDDFLSAYMNRQVFQKIIP